MVLANLSLQDFRVYGVVTNMDPLFRTNPLRSKSSHESPGAGLLSSCSVRGLVVWYSGIHESNTNIEATL